MPPQQQQPVSSQPPGQPSSNKTLLIVLISVSALVFVAVAVGLLVFFLRGDRSDKETSETETSETEEESEDEDDGEDGEDGEETGATDSGADDENVDRPPEDADDTAGTQELNQSQLAAIEQIKQNRQDLIDTATAVGLREVDLQSYISGTEAFIDLFENNRDAFASLSEEEQKAWLEELEATTSILQERLAECQDAYDSGSSSDEVEEAIDCMLGALNGYGQALILINQKYGLID